MGIGNGVETTEIFVGIDLSLTGTGLIVLDQDANIMEQKLISTKAKDITEVRLLQILEELKFVPTIAKLKKVNIEGLSFGSRGQSMLELAALHYFIRIYMFQKDVPYEIIPPTQLKKHITGKGNAKKELMLMKIYKKWGVEFSDNNIADAYALARHAMEN